MAERERELSSLQRWQGQGGKGLCSHDLTLHPAGGEAVQVPQPHTPEARPFSRQIVLHQDSSKEEVLPQMIFEPLRNPRIYLSSLLYGYGLSLAPCIHLPHLPQSSAVQSRSYLPRPRICAVCSQKALHALAPGPGQQMNLAQA